MSGEQPEVQVIANVVAVRGDGRVLLVRHDVDDERWWLPGEDLRPYQHPDERAREVLEEIGGLICRSIQMVFVESFRGRRGWHVVFHYRAVVDGEPSGDFVEAGWFDSDMLPRTMHGAWEQRAVNRVLAQSTA